MIRMIKAVKIATPSIAAMINPAIKITGERIIRIGISSIRSTSKVIMAHRKAANANNTVKQSHENAKITVIKSHTKKNNAKTRIVNICYWSFLLNLFECSFSLYHKITCESRLYANIILTSLSHFDVSVNDVSEEFAERLQTTTNLVIYK